MDKIYKNIDEAINDTTQYYNYDKIKNLRFVPDNLIEAFNKPIGIFDPFGENINPFTGKQYTNMFSNEDMKPYSNILDSNNNPILYKKTYKNQAYGWTKMALYDNLINFMNLLDKNQVCLIKAGTGVGKTVILPRAVLQYYNFQKKIICSVPKKSAASGAAAYAASNLDVVLGNEVGYLHKGANIINNNTKLVFITAGSLISILLKNPNLSEYSSLLIDEVHERSVEVDQLIMLMSKLCIKRPDFKIILISATVDSSIFKNQFETKFKLKYGELILEVPDTFTVSDSFIDKPVSNNKVVETVVDKLYNILTKTDAKTGDIIAFIKGGGEGKKIMDLIKPKFKTILDKENPINPFFCIYSGETSHKDFESYINHPTNYKSIGFIDPITKIKPQIPYTRKVILSTNAGESSVTFNNIGYVVDPGYANITEFYPLVNSDSLLEKRIAQANAKQRRGRTGRTIPGICYRLYTQDEFNSFDKFPLPDIQKTDITMNILGLFFYPKVLDFKDVNNLLNDFISKPPNEFIYNALIKLYIVGAIKKENINNQIENQKGGGDNKFKNKNKNKIGINYYNFLKELEKEREKLVKNKKNINMSIKKPILKKSEEMLLFFKNHENDKLTDLGRVIKKFSSLSLSEAYSIIYSYYSGCLNEMCNLITILNIIKNKIDTLILPYKKTNEKTPEEIKINRQILFSKQRKFFHKFGDHFTILEIYKQFKNFMDDEKNNEFKNDDIENDLNQLKNDEPTKTKKDFKKWGNLNGINIKLLVNNRGGNKWDIVKEESMNLKQRLMSGIEPSDLKLKYYDEYYNNEVNFGRRPKTQEQLLKDIFVETIDEDNENLIGEEDIVFNENIDVIIQSGGGKGSNKKINKLNSINRLNSINKLNEFLNKRFINKKLINQKGGYKKKNNYELNLFPYAFDRYNPELNLLNALLEGNKYNIAYFNKDKSYYNTCFPIESANATLDQNTTLVGKPEYIIYNSLNMLNKNGIFQMNICSSVDILKDKIKICKNSKKLSPKKLSPKKLSPKK